MRIAMMTFLLVVIAGAGMAAEGTVYVDNSAAGANNGASWADAYTTLAAAINDPKFANNGQGGCTIVVAKGKGPYQGGIVLGKQHSGKEAGPNIIKGKEGEAPHLAAEGKHAISVQYARDIVLENLELTTVAAKIPEDATEEQKKKLKNPSLCGVETNGVTGHLVLRGLRVHDTPYVGIRCYGRGHTEIERCVVWNSRLYNMYFRGMDKASRITINHCTTYHAGGSAEIGIRKCAASLATVTNTAIIARRARAFYADLDANLTVKMSHNAYTRAHDYGKVPETVKAPSFADTDVDLRKIKPGFTDPENGDFTLKPDSPLRGKAEGGANIGAYPK